MIKWLKYRSYLGVGFLNYVLPCKYTLEDFTKLLDLLSKIEGKFLLTSYPSEILQQYTQQNGWLTIENEMNLSASAKVGTKKIEVFTMNYKQEQKQITLFD